MLRVDDFVMSIGKTTLGAVCVGSGLRFVGSLLLSRRGRLVAKLFVVWLALQIVEYATTWIITRM